VTSREKTAFNEGTVNVPARTTCPFLPAVVVSIVVVACFVEISGEGVISFSVADSTSTTAPRSRPWATAAAAAALCGPQ
jgi:hypothetical protein